MMSPERLPGSLLLPIVFLLGACQQHAAPAPAKPTVTVATPAGETVRQTIELDGVIAASATVNLVARVAGYLESAPYREGQQVKAGQVLFVIEPASYRAQVKINEAKLVQARAEADRQATLLAQNATSQSSVESAQSQLLQAQANLDLARLDLSYTQVRASFDGVVGQRQVDVGNYVGAGGATVLATLNRVRPAYVQFSLNERDVLRLRSLPGVGKGTAKDGVGRIPVSVQLQDEAAPSATGTLDFIGNGLDATTGTIPMRATFPNDDLHLVPGMYARVSIEVGAPRQALLVPLVALQADQQGSYLYVVDKDGITRRRNGRKGDQFGQRAEIVEGLAADDRVVVNGLSSIGDGTPVTAQAADAPVTG
ncbi:MAG: efflux RND transporter periplasmic adaptor subunit [Steroidobacteraceae bacterium]